MSSERSDELALCRLFCYTWNVHKTSIIFEEIRFKKVMEMNFQKLKNVDIERLYYTIYQCLDYEFMVRDHEAAGSNPVTPTIDFAWLAGLRALLLFCQHPQYTHNFI